MRVGMIDTQGIRQRWELVGSKLDERGRRVFAAGEVRAAGWGGLEAVSQITGLARSTIGRGQKELDTAPLPKGWVRRKGGGRRHLSSRDATLIEDLRSVPRASHARRSHAPAVVGVEKPRQAGLRVAEEGPRDQRQQREEAVADARLQPTVEPQGRRGLEASRPQCAIRAHQHQGTRRTGRGAARHLGRHQEEGTDRQL